MKALKSDFAKRVLKDPESARALSRLTLKPGFGPESAVSVVVTPIKDDGTRDVPQQISVMRVHKAGWVARAS